jgi:His-Xaa-Ser system radical SAM maturase HxsC
MKIGVSHHTHAKVKGVEGVRILKLLGENEAYWDSLPDYWTACRQGDEWVGGGVDIIRIVSARNEEVIGPGDVIRVREGSTMVSVLWRRGARTNSLFATERCNSLCLMCSQPPRDDDDSWRIHELLTTISLIDKDEKHLGITGGEPTLLGDGLVKVLHACANELPDTSLHVLTNGRLFKHSDRASAWINAAKTQTTWAVPLYGDVYQVHDEVVAVRGAFDETLDGLYELARHDANVEVRVVLHKLTIPRLRQLAAFIYRRLPFVKHVALMGLEPMGFAKVNRERLWIDPAAYLDELRDAIFFLANRGMAVSIYNLQLCILPRSLWPFARQSISEWKNIYVPECEGCVLRPHCAGFFVSAGANWRSQKITTIGVEDFSYEVA